MILTLPILATALLTNVVSSLPTPNLVVRQEGAPSWADVEEASIHPGVNTDTQGGSCTSNFIYYNSAGDIFIGQAAHCSSRGEATETDGCSSDTYPEGTKVNVTGASVTGTMVYNSWARMQSRGESDANTCAYNDLALIKLDPSDHSKVNPSVPVFGGPTGIRTSDLSPGEPLYAYGNSVLRQGIKVLSPKYGIHTNTEGDGWSHNVLLQFGIPGDSGSGTFDGEGKAAGVLSTLALAPIPTSNGYGDFSRELKYLHSFDEFADVKLAHGTKEFAVRPPELVR